VRPARRARRPHREVATTEKAHRAAAANAVAPASADAAVPASRDEAELAGRRGTRTVIPPPVSATVERAAAWTWRLLVCAAGLAAVLALLWYLRVIVLPVAVALTIAPALAPVASWARGRRFLERPAAALALLVGLGTAAVLVAIVAVSIVEQFDELVDTVSRAVDDLLVQLGREPFNSIVQTDELRSTLDNSWREVSSHAASGVQAGAGVVAGFVLAISMLYFVLRDGEALWAAILRRCSREARPAVDRAGRRAWDVLGGFVRGTVQVATIDAVLIGLGLWLLDVPLAFALAVLVFLGSFVPYVGAFASGLIAVLVGFADGGWELALAVLALVAAVQFIEGTFLQPVIQSRKVHLHPAVVLLAVAAGGSLFGIAGAYLAVPVTAVIAAILGSLPGEEAEQAEPNSASG
jgi:putative heme transporter